METKKFEKKKLVQVLNPLVQNHIRARVVDFFIAGHIYNNVCDEWDGKTTEGLKGGML